MDIRAYVDSYPVFNRWNRERHEEWAERVQTLDETADLAEQYGGASAQDLALIRDYRDVVEQGLQKSRSNDRKLSVTKAVTHAAAFGFVGSFFSMFHAADPGSLALRLGLTLGCGFTMVGGELLFRNFLARGQACGDEPQRSLDALSPAHKTRVAEYLLKRDAIKEVVHTADGLKRQEAANLSLDLETVNIDGFVLDIRDEDVSVVGVDLPRPDPRFG